MRDQSHPPDFILRILSLRCPLCGAWKSNVFLKSLYSAFSRINSCFSSASSSNHQHLPLPVSADDLESYFTEKWKSSEDFYNPCHHKPHPLPGSVPIHFSLIPGNAEELGEAFLPNANPSAGELGWAFSHLLKGMALVSVLCLSCIIHFTLLVHLHTYNNAVISHAFRNLECTHFPHFSVSLCNKIPWKNCKETVSKSSFPVLSEAHSVQVFTIIPPLKLCSSRLLLNPMDSSNLIRPNLSSIWTNQSHCCPHTTSSSASRTFQNQTLLVFSSSHWLLFLLKCKYYFGCTEYQLKHVEF